MNTITDIHPNDRAQKPLHSYLLIRADMPLEAQMAQCAHAAQEAAFMLGPKPDIPIHVIILSCPDEAALLAAGERLAKKGIETHIFYEPDWPQGHTALYAKPQQRSSALRAAMGAYPLWRAPQEPQNPIRVVPTDNPLNPTIDIPSEGETMARLCHLLHKTGLALADRLYGLRHTMEQSGIHHSHDLDALDKLADLIDYGSGPQGWAKACDALESGYADFREQLRESHVGDCTAVACSCTRCWAESALGIHTAPPSKAIGHRLLCEQMALAKTLENKASNATLDTA
jgi:hypothetical protein